MTRNGKPISSRSKWRSLLVVLLIFTQIMFLLGLTSSYYSLVRHGQEVRVQTTPLESYHFNNNNVVQLSYDISELSSSLWMGSQSFSIEEHVRKTIYIVLKSTNESHHLANHYEAVGVYDMVPTVNDDEVMLIGRLQYAYDGKLYIKYGFERFGVSEDKKKELETIRGVKIAVLKVSSSGKAIIVDLLNQ